MFCILFLVKKNIFTDQYQFIHFWCKKHIYRPITFYTFLNIPFFLLHICIEVVTQGVAKYLQIMTSLNKKVAILHHFASPGYRIFKNLSNVKLYDSQALFSINKAIICFDRTIIGVSKVKSNIVR